MNLGAGRRVYQDVMDVKILAAYNDSPFLGHDPVGPIWSSELIDIGGGLIEEVRLPADGGWVFRDGSTPFGPHDFQINPGSPFLIRAPAGATVEFSGPPGTSQPEKSNWHEPMQPSVPPSKPSEAQLSPARFMPSQSSKPSTAPLPHAPQPAVSNPPQPASQPSVPLSNPSVAHD